MTPFARITVGSYAILAVTTVHHLYGAIRFDTPWRMHVVHVAAIVGIGLAVCLILRRCVPVMQRPAEWALLAIAVVAPLGWIGLYEGGYNHVVKDLLYALTGPGDLWRSLFPAPTYEPPVDFWFEATGLLQVVLAVWTAPALWHRGR